MVCCTEGKYELQRSQDRRNNRAWCSSLLVEMESRWMSTGVSIRRGGRPIVIFVMYL